MINKLNTQEHDYKHMKHSCLNFKHTKGMIKWLCDLSVNSFLRSLREI